MPLKNAETVFTQNYAVRNMRPKHGVCLQMKRWTPSLNYITYKIKKGAFNPSFNSS